MKEARSGGSPGGVPPARFVRFAYAGSLALPWLALHALALTDAEYWPWAAGFNAYGLLGLWLLELAVRRGRAAGVAGLALALAALHLFLVTPEACLRLAGFRYESGVSFGFPRPDEFVRFRADEDLFWTLRPDSPEVSPQGFKTRPLPREAEPGLKRVVVLGDSVAFQGYPEIAEGLLNAGARQPGARGRTRWEVLNMSIAGYSSHQGRKVLERWGEAMAADVGVVSYGWNDHWLAWGAEDAEKVVTVDRSRIGRFTADLVHRSRILQASLSMVSARGAGAGDSPRVPLARYRENLAFMGDFFEARGARPLFVALPAAHHRFGVPVYLIENGFAADWQSVVELHRVYNGAVREVAGARDWPVLDLEAELGPLPEEALRPIFFEDGIHLTDAGEALFAQRLTAAVVELTAR